MLKAELQRERGREEHRRGERKKEKNLISNGLHSKWPELAGLGQTKTRSLELCPVSHVSVWDKRLGPSSFSFPGALAASCSGSGAAGT